jgi:hypothetical protein
MDTMLQRNSDWEVAAGRPGKRAGRRNGFTVVRLLLGLILLIAACLKLGDDEMGVAEGFGPLASPRGRLVAVEVEALLGVALLLGLGSRLLWIVALLFFSGLAGMSLYMGIEGQPSCGCFGRSIGFSPWYALGLDLTAVASLVVWHPSQGPWIAGSGSSLLHLTVTVSVISGMMVVAVVGLVAWVYGSPYQALLHARKELIAVEPIIVPVGEVGAGEVRTFTIQLSNHRDWPIRIVGGTATCSCITTEDLPLNLLPKETRSITVWVKGVGEPGQFQRSFMLYTDDDEQPTVRAWFQGCVIK